MPDAVPSPPMLSCIKINAIRLRSLRLHDFSRLMPEAAKIRRPFFQCSPVCSSWSAYTVTTVMILLSTKIHITMVVHPQGFKGETQLVRISATECHRGSTFRTSFRPFDALIPERGTLSISNDPDSFRFIILML